MKQIIGSLIILLLAAQAFGQELTLEQLQKTLRARNGAGWVAGETSVSRLPFEDRKKMLGVPLESDDEFFTSRTPRESNDRLPAKLDWRDMDGHNYVTPILDQGRCGSCVAFAAVAQLEAQMNIVNKSPFAAWAFSAQHLFSCGGGGCNLGWFPNSAVRFLRDKGVPDEACFPYASGANGDDQACKLSCTNADQRSTKIITWSTPTFFLSNTEKVKEALQKGPLMTSFSVYEDFMFYKGGVYKHVTGKVVGGHAVTIVGYDDADKAWLIQNSWGENWGEKGFFRMAYTEGIARQTWAIEVGPKDGYVAVKNLRDRSLLQGKVSMEFVSTFPNTDRIEWKMKKDGRTVGSGVSVANGRDDVSTAEFTDGVYEMVATAVHGKGMSESQPRLVHVLNGELEGKLAITSLKDGDVLKGKADLKFETTAKPVPFSIVTVKIRNLSSGQLVINRSTTNVGPKMGLSWNTKSQKNGEYLMWLEGSAGEQVVKSPEYKVKVEN